tara:strand:- start:192 stop:386 length:195 start_codon:yes stop_codon:yes gene_type:complete
MAISRKDMLKDMLSSESADRVFATVEDAEHYIEESKKKTHFDGPWDAMTYRLAQVKCGIPLEDK